MLTLSDADANALSTACTPIGGPRIPRVLYRTLAALIGTETVTSAHTLYHPGSRSTKSERTRWTLWATTDRHLVHVDLEIHTSHFDLDEEASMRWATEPPAMQTHAAWVRPLRSIAGLSLGSPAFGSISRNGSSQVLLKSITIEFADAEHGRETVAFAVGATSSEASRKVAGEFVSELRRGLITP